MFQKVSKAPSPQWPDDIWIKFRKESIVITVESWMHFHWENWEHWSDKRKSFQIEIVNNSKMDPVNLDRFGWTCGQLDSSLVSLMWSVRSLKSGQKVKPTNYRMKISLKIDVIIIDYHIAKFAQFFKPSLSQSPSLFAIWSESTNRVRNDVTDFLFISQQTTWSHKRSLIGQIKQLK